MRRVGNLINITYIEKRALDIKLGRCFWTACVAFNIKVIHFDGQWSLDNTSQNSGPLRDYGGTGVYAG